MTRSIQRLRRGVLAAAVAAALGFGGTQALATPRAQDPGPLCDSAQCDQICKLLLAPGGFCSRGSCFCYR